MTTALNPDQAATCLRLRLDDMGFSEVFAHDGSVYTLGDANDPTEQIHETINPLGERVFVFARYRDRGSGERKSEPEVGSIVLRHALDTTNIEVLGWTCETWSLHIEGTDLCPTEVTAHATYPVALPDVRVPFLNLWQGAEWYHLNEEDLTTGLIEGERGRTEVTIRNLPDCISAVAEYHSPGEATSTMFDLWSAPEGTHVTVTGDHALALQRRVDVALAGAVRKSLQQAGIGL
jgi:hypothetical protein